MEKFEIRCKQCLKLLAKIDKNGYCYKIHLYCPRCKKEYEYTYNDEIKNKSSKESQ